MTPSISTTGSIPANVPVTKASSALSTSFIEKFFSCTMILLSLHNFLKEDEMGKKKTIYVSHNDKSGLISTYAENLIDAVKERDKRAFVSFKYMLDQNEGNECVEMSTEYTIIGLVVGYDNISNGPEIITLQDENDYKVDIVVWDWDLQSSAIGFMVDPYDPSRYTMHVKGKLGTYQCGWQFEVETASDILLYDIDYPQGDLVEDEMIMKAEIVTAPYVIIPSLGERLDFHYSFPSNSRVIIRILDLNGLFITSLVDRFYKDAGKVERYVDYSDWNGRDHIGQIVSPGTYLIHIEASNFQTGKTSVDVAPIVVGVHH